MKKLLSYLKSRLNYSRVTGIVLFVIGLVGFAFRSNSSLPDIYLLGALIFGFWGIVVSFYPKEGNS